MPRRSRGCRECRQRRIGCDGALPSCRQCLVTNRPCSGPVQGPIFIDQTGGVTSRYSRSPMHSQIHIQPMIRQPSPRGIYSLAFVSAFVSSVTAKTASPSRSAWLCQLEGIPKNERGPALDLSLQAVALAYCGAESRNHGAAMESRRLYGEAIAHHSKALSQGFEALGPAMLYTSIILSLFERIWSTSAAAYAIHLTAARKMLDLADWEVTQNEILRQVAMLVQNQTLFMMIASPLDDTEVDSGTRAWSDTLSTQSEGSQPVADQLTAQLFRLWKFIRAQKLEVDSNKTASHLHSIGSSITKIWISCQEDAALRGEALSHSSAGKTVYRDGSSALMEAYFAAAQVMLSLAGPLAPSHSFLTSEDPCQTILTCVSYLFRERTSIGCVGHDMFLPLTLVALHSTSLKCRSMAHTFLEDRLREMPFQGLRAIVVQRIKSVDDQGIDHSKRARDGTVGNCQS
ncbi:hypothetical protein BJ170DRAFT_161838 [Xylariales sp. AK1849]|nr:hypothetical protein BJ170DRAFT_161838 [Xylariales sp. AK1849]